MLRLSGVCPQVMCLSPGFRGLADSLNVLVHPFPSGPGGRTRGSSSICLFRFIIVLSFLSGMCVILLCG